LTVPIHNLGLKQLEKIMRNVLLCSFALRGSVLVVCLLAIVALSTGVRAQTQITSGTIQGTVVDANGAAVPGATVEIKNIDTNSTTDRTTNED